MVALCTRSNVLAAFFSFLHSLITAGKFISVTRKINHDMKSTTVRSLLAKAKIDELLKSKTRKVLTVLDTVTVESALGTLAQNRILSAPMLTQARIAQ